MTQFSARQGGDTHLPAEAGSGKNLSWGFLIALFVLVVGFRKVAHLIDGRDVGRAPGPEFEHEIRILQGALSEGRSVEAGVRKERLNLASKLFF